MRGVKSVQLSEELGWKLIKELIPDIKSKTAHYEHALLTKGHARPCRVVTTYRQPKGRKVKTSRGKTTSTLSNGSYSQANKEPWILATNLPLDVGPVDIINLYFKKMQIEESFRDVKSHQFGLAGRYLRTHSVNRWGVKMLLAAIVEITYWVIGVIAHSQNKQQYFQANTVKDKKIFS
ncbi:TPA: transposase [Legionella pneumophila subsp. pneumophila]|nr:transposase [Legionella pneumophila subsp. pneumophila]